MDKEGILYQAIWVATANITHLQDVAQNGPNYSARKMAEYLLAIEQDKLASLSAEAKVLGTTKHSPPKIGGETA